MEITIPLLEPYKLEPEPPEPEILPPDSKLTGKKSKNGKNIKGSNKGSKKSISKGSKKGGKKGKNAEDSPYAAPDEYENEIKAKIKNISFKTERQPWEKIIQFPDEALSVKVPNNIEKKLTLMRDAFRTIANVKAIFTQVLPPSKPGKKDKKDKKKDKKDKGKDKGKGKDKKSDKGKGKGKKGKGEKDKSTTLVKEVEPEPEPTETIVKKITLANFDCELRAPNWSNKTMDYYWCKHPKFPPNKAVEVEGSLRKIFYMEVKKSKKGKGKEEKGGKGKKDNKDKGNKKGKGSAKSSKSSVIDSKRGKKSKGSKSSISSKGSKKGKKGSKGKGLHVEEEDEFVIMKTAPVEDILPDMFTVQVGFGLKRTPPEKIKLESEETPAVLHEI